MMFFYSIHFIIKLLKEVVGDQIDFIFIVKNYFCGLFITNHPSISEHMYLIIIIFMC